MQELHERAKNFRVEAEQQQLVQQEEDKALVEKLAGIYDQKAIAELLREVSGSSNGHESLSIAGLKGKHRKRF